jgi:carbamoyltransferase
MVLNTSFNLRGEPIVHHPAEAVADFLASDMDALFLGFVLAEKTRGPSLART